jgi:hypothetical protein
VQSDVPECLVVFFRFMAARGALSGDPLRELEATCMELRGQFLSNCRDPRLWDAAKVRLSLIVPSAPGDPHDAHPPSARLGRCPTATCT